MITAALPSAPVAEPETGTGAHETVEPLRPYAVILFNDDVNSMDHVVRSLCRSVPTLSVVKAVRIMIEAHNSGRAVVVVCPLELAELYRDRLESCGLTATIEDG